MSIQVIKPIGIENPTSIGTPSIYNIWQDFEMQIQAIFCQVLNLDSNNLMIKPYDTEYDFAFTYKQTNYIVEVKYYRTKLAQMRLLIGAANRLINIVTQLEQQEKKYLPILVVSCTMSGMQKAQILKQFPELILIDRENLISTTAGQVDLMNYLTPFFGVTELDFQNTSDDLLTLLQKGHHE